MFSFIHKCRYSEMNFGQWDIYVDININMNLLEAAMVLLWQLRVLLQNSFPQNALGGPSRYLFWREPLLGCFSSPIPGTFLLLQNFLCLHFTALEFTFCILDWFLVCFFVLQLSFAGYESLLYNHRKKKKKRPFSGWLPSLIWTMVIFSCSFLLFKK